MMRCLLITVLFVLNSHLGANELPWMGVSLHSADLERKHETSLPRGVGFQVSKVIMGGPAAQAGAKAGDLWWKIDGQILINKGQMLVLLRTKKPGDEVQVEFYRGAELNKVSLTLGNREERRFLPVSFREGNPDEARMLAMRKKVARVKVDGHDLSLESEGVNWRFKVEKEGVTVLSSLVTKPDMMESVPAKWQPSFLILQMTLGDRRQGPVNPAKKRVRYIPRQKTKTPVE